MPRMKVRITIDVGVDNYEDFQALKTAEHHAEYLLDLDEWPEIKTVSNVDVERIDSVLLTKDYIAGILRAYVDNDYSATSDGFYIRDALHAAGCSDEDIRALGFDWVLDLTEEEGGAVVYDEPQIPHGAIQKAEQVLKDNGIEEDEVQTVLQAIGYALMDKELYPDK